MRDFKNVKRIVIKVGTSTLTHAGGNLNLKRIEELVRVVSDMKNSGKEVVLVTSGAIGVGVARLKLGKRPSDVKGKQAAAAVGQSILMGIYDKLFGEYGNVVGQVLITRDCMIEEIKRCNAMNTFGMLLEYGAVPIVNENDTVAVDEIKFGDNDTLAAYVACLINADMLVLLTDVDGLYDKNPNQSDAKLIAEIKQITEQLKQIAGGAGSANGTGGMITKLLAAEIAGEKGIGTVIINGSKPSFIYDILDGKKVGTYFNIKKETK